MISSHASPVASRVAAAQHAEGLPRRQIHGEVVRSITLREEDPPSDTIVIVRGGSMLSEFVRRTATDAYAEMGIYAVSVYLAIDEPVQTLCRANPHLLRYGRVRLSLVGTVRAAGFALIPTLARPHYDVVLPDLSDSSLVALDRCFGEATPNPGRA